MVKLFLLAPALLCMVVSANAVPQCYYPGGTITVPGHTACNQTISGYSACCDPLDSCSTSGFCLGRSGWLYRGSCTDKDWKSPNCANQYDQCLNNPVTGQPMEYFAAMWSCSPEGAEMSDFCCGYGSSSCCNSSFTLGTSGVAFKPGLDAFVQSISSAAVASATGSATGTSTSTAAKETSSSSADANCPDPNLGTKVGLGVGIPLGVLAIGILTFLFWRGCSKRKTSGTGAPMTQDYTNGAVYHHDSSQPAGMGRSYSPVPMHSPPAENTYSSPQKVNQWSPAPMYEAPANLRVQELPN